MTLFDIFKHTSSPDSTLLYNRNDENDRRLGETVKYIPEDYPKADVVILGCPQDDGVIRNQGRPGARKAPDQIRSYFYRLVADPLAQINLFDLGNTRIQATLEETHTLHREIVRQLIADGKRVIMLGGGNDVSYPDASAVALNYHQELLTFNIDAHFDVREDEIRNSGTPYRQLIEGGYIQPEHFYEIGSQLFSNSTTYRNYLLRKGAHVIGLDDLRKTNTSIVECIREILATSTLRAIFWGIDLDVVKMSDAPGVSAPNPTGISGIELCEIARLAGEDKRTRLIEFSEVNPDHDIDGRTCRLTGAAIFYYLLGYVRQKDSTND